MGPPLPPPSSLESLVLPAQRPAFGHQMKEYFHFDPEYVNLNHGSYGSLPRPVSAWCGALSDKIERNPDLFMRLTYQPMLVAVREKVASFIGVSNVDEVVLVPNASHGVNTVLKNFIWEKGDVIITCNTTYGSISRTAQYISDIPPHPEEDIVSRWRDHLKSVRERIGKNAKIVAVIDAIISNPGALLPWEVMTDICREFDIQDIKLDEVKPDFWISNCHKWLFAKRGAAVLYVPKRNQHIVKSSFPTSSTYVSPKDRTGPNFVEQFEWNGTIDWAPYLSIAAALEFRKWLGGETVINEHCHNLAIEGGKTLAKVLNTKVMDEDGQFTAHMVNVVMPLSGDLKPTLELDQMLKNKLLVKHNVYAAPYYHNGMWWVRCSAQIWNEVEDFKKLGTALPAVCGEIEKEYKAN
ncbi:pyridoxal phosphate-dependent transferase [Desarmillaria tabescens]|uniref:Pyridoxal phosphate-dependent transferase n=1 Tax=Armillaria tabescens TaxID=1929756 RepID=A0AA39K1B6_ARMTA|nr:pyridoxal phosphate-dependent transferase [Desarmillaria tabescens]KAK0452766.1 pyridoxal phosphate-dependent transferase [Desarmillaria tabescens]